MSDAERYLHGSHAVITGASRGIGLAIAGALAARGARLTLLARSREALAEHAGALSREHRVEVFGRACDVTDARAVRAVLQAAALELGPVHVLVNNAGAAETAAVTHTSLELWNRMLAVNLTSAFLCASEVLPEMLEARAGRIVNIASTAGLRGYKMTAAYCAAKHGVIGLTRAMALEVAKHGITVNAVCPGYTDTDMHAAAVSNLVSALGKSDAQARAMLLRTVPRGTLTQPGEVAAAVEWLCGPGSGAVTGIALPVAGGEVM